VIKEANHGETLMPDLAQETLHRVLNILEGVQRAVMTARNSTKIPTGYQNFELVLTTLAGCRQSIEGAHDQEQLIERLRKASEKLGLWEAGLTETVVRAARLAINEAVADLEAKKPTV
jgi:hypothetical protein